MSNTFLIKISKSIISLPFFRNYFASFYRKLIASNSSLNEVQVVSETRDGLKFNLYIKDWIQANLFFLGHYEQAELRLLKSILKEGDTFIDLGTNIGLYSLTASKIVGQKGRVISFEPFGKNYDTFIHNLELNHLSNTNVVPEKKAVGKSDSTLMLYSNSSDSNMGMVSTKERTHTHKESVESVSLDTYLKKNKINKVDLIKIDIEGHEKDALIGMAGTTKDIKPSFIIEILEGEDKQFFIDFFNSQGYTRYFITNDGQLSSVNTNLRRHNYVFINEK